MVEKDTAVATQQSGHNSGVLHAGLYYQPGSLKARLCREGRALMERYCAEKGLPVVPLGKVIVAVDEKERPALQTLLQRGRANGVPCELVDRAGLRRIEPHAAGIEALYCLRHAGFHPATAFTLLRAGFILYAALILELPALAAAFLVWAFLMGGRS